MPRTFLAKLEQIKKTNKQTKKLYSEMTPNRQNNLEKEEQSWRTHAP